jgi:hypothetical protein
VLKEHQCVGSHGHNDYWYVSEEAEIKKNTHIHIVKTKIHFHFRMTLGKPRILESLCTSGAQTLGFSPEVVITSTVSLNSCRHGMSSTE